MSEGNAIILEKDDVLYQSIINDKFRFMFIRYDVKDRLRILETYVKYSLKGKTVSDSYSRETLYKKIEEKKLKINFKGQRDSATWAAIESSN